ncbi:MAG: acyltransferase [Deltaproteobacteria bacterium]|nr:acyltransferase [Deltaproteobacteria bacterium]
MRKLREIERLRGVAIVLAIFNHPPLHEFTPRFSGVVGVHLFFVISGFVITRSLLKLLPADGSSAIPALKIFFVRRFFRIVPLAVVSAAVVLTASIFYNSSKVWSPPAMVLQEIGWIFTLSYNYRLLTLGPDLLFFWSLNVEEHFYLALPLLMLAVRSPRARMLSAAAGVLFIAFVVRPLTAPRALMTTNANEIWIYHFTTHARIDTLMAGVWLALIAHARLLARPRATRLLGLSGNAIGFSCLAVLLYVFHYFSIESQSAWSLVLAASLALVWLASLSRGLILGQPLVAQAFEYLGSRSYAVYLLHLPVWKIALEFLARHPDIRTYSHPVELAAYYLLLTLCTADLAHRLVEVPMQSLGRRVADRLLPTNNFFQTDLREAA